MMYSYDISVGRPEVTVRLVSIKEAGQHDFRRIPLGGGMFAKPGDTFVMLADGCPVVVTTARQEMMVAHANVNTISTVIETFFGQGARVDEIVMCIQFATIALESELVERARQAGLRYVWAMNSFTHAHKDLSDLKHGLIMVKRIA